MRWLFKWPYEWRVGWRYTRAGRSSRRNGFISFISGISIIGIALGVAALIIVLSVMNGFQKEVRDRMLSVIAHVELFDAQGQALSDWRALARRAGNNPEVIGVAPFIPAQALIARGEDMRGTMVRGIDPAQEAQVTPLGARIQPVLAQLKPGGWGVVIGMEMARSLGLRVGDPVTLVAPSGQVTPAGVVPRLKQMQVVGLFESGHYEYDSGTVMIHIEDAAKLFRTGGPVAVQLKLKQATDARSVGNALSESLGANILVRDWTRTNSNWFDAVQIEKRMMFIILTLIVSVAAFNLVSTLVMTVTDKRSDIAILRTLGASPYSIMGIFMVQGALSGILGTLSGLGLGLWVAFNVDVIVPFIERLLGIHFLPSSIYLISSMPSDPQASDIMPVTLVALVLSFVATLYPSWRASRVQPVEALRYD